MNSRLGDKLLCPKIKHDFKLHICSTISKQTEREYSYVFVHLLLPKLHELRNVLTIFKTFFSRKILVLTFFRPTINV